MGRAVEAGPIFVFAYGVGTPLRIAMNVKCRGDANRGKRGKY